MIVVEGPKATKPGRSVSPESGLLFSIFWQNLLTSRLPFVYFLKDVHQPASKHPHFASQTIVGPVVAAPQATWFFLTVLFQHCPIGMSMMTGNVFSRKIALLLRNNDG
jgi:hypothetical protein